MAPLWLATCQAESDEDESRCRVRYHRVYQAFSVQIHVMTAGEASKSVAGVLAMQAQLQLCFERVDEGPGGSDTQHGW